LPYTDEIYSEHPLDAWITTVGFLAAVSDTDTISRLISVDFNTGHYQNLTLFVSALPSKTMRHHEAQLMSSRFYG